MGLRIWGQRLCAAVQAARTGQRAARRKMRIPQIDGVESLETRALLTAPVVIDGAANPSEDQAYPGTLANLGSDADGNTLSYSVVTSPSHGTLTLNPTGTFTYTPAANYNGPDEFTFKANDGSTDSNIGSFELTVNPVDDALKLTFPSGTTQIPRNSTPVRIDPAATVVDVDTPVNFANTQIRALMSSGNSIGDHQKGRVILKVQAQLAGAYTVEVIGSNIYYNGNSVATFSGGSLGRALVIKFRNTATAESVNAVLKQISIQASKKATSNTTTAGVGIRLVDVTISAGGQKTLATKTVSII